MRAFKLKPKCAPHDHYGTIVEDEGIVECEEDLAALFPHKFEEIVAVQSPVPELDEELSAPESVVSELGKDVTSAFPKAADLGLLVFHKRKRFRPADPEDPNKALAKGMTQGDMEDWLEDRARDEEDEDEADEDEVDT